MYRGFNINGVNIKEGTDELYNLGLKSFHDNKNKALKKLKNYISVNGVIDGSKLEADWFPQMDYDIFMSHSHQDEDAVITFAEWLKKNFGLRVFIDSCIWGNSDSLLKQIDNEYCQNNDRKTYSYSQRNRSTSHVHMMLSTALTKMIDKTECLLFYNTPNSISAQDVIDKKTESPWIYSELTTSQIIYHRKPKRIIEKEKSFSKAINESKQLHIQYPVNLTHLQNINSEILNKVSKQGKRGIEVLDELYELLPINENLLNK